MPATIDDPAILEEIKGAMKEKGVGVANLFPRMCTSGRHQSNNLKGHALVSYETCARLRFGRCERHWPQRCYDYKSRGR
jgi:hypothetical protein